MLKLKDKMSFRGALWSAAIEEAFAGYYLIFYPTLCRENSNFRHQKYSCAKKPRHIYCESDMSNSLVDRERKKPKKKNKELKTIKIRLKTIVFWKSLYLI